MSGDPSAGVVCILNAKAASSGAERERENLVALFKERGRNARLILANGDEMARQAKKAVESKVKMVVAAGGDGTINTVAGALADMDVALGVLPLGTLNHFAKDLKIPLKLEDAVANVFTGEVARIDIGEVNGHFFLNNSSLGLYPGLVQIRETLQRGGHGKWPAFARAIVFALWHYSPLAVRLSLDDAREVAVSTPFVFVGNNRYVLDASHVGQRPSLRNGRLWICQAPHAGRAKLARLAVSALLGKPNTGELTMLEAEEFWIRTRTKRLPVANDGEVIRMRSPLHYRIKRGALHVIVPKANAKMAAEA